MKNVWKQTHDQDTICVPQTQEDQDTIGYPDTIKI